MPDGWELAIFIHIVAVFTLGGTAAVSDSTYAMMRHARTVQEVRLWGSLGRILSQFFVFPITAVTLILSGAYLVDKLGYDWDEGWILFSLIAVLAGSFLGMTVITPRMKAIGEAAGPAPDGPVPDEVTERLNDPLLYGATNANLLIVVGIMWNMTVRPDTLGALLSVLILGGLGMASGLTRLQSASDEAMPS